ncbi:Multidrug export protein EmrB [compost metagenome]
MSDSRHPVPSIWLMTCAIMAGAIAAVMGASTINVALADVMAGLAISRDQVSWVSTAYMLANVIAIPTAAWLGHLLSKRVVFTASLGVFMLGSVLCGLSWDFGSMIAFRILQGLGAGLIMPTAQMLLFEGFPPHKRGLAMGVYGLGAIMGPSIGPTLGGYLVEWLNWRAIFFINLPFGLVSLAMIGLLPRAPRQVSRGFDAPAFVAMVVCFSTLQIALSNGAKDGWDAPYIIACFATCAVSGALLVLRELSTESPLLDLDVFRHGTYNVATIVSLVVGLGLYGTTFMLPLYLGNVLGYTALEIGLIMLPGSLVMGLMMLFSGRLSDLIDNRLLLLAGLGIFAYSLFDLSLATVESSRAFYLWTLVWRGLGLGLVFSPLSAIALAGVPPHLRSQATGIFNLTRQLAGTVGIAVMSTLLTTRTTFHMQALGQTMSGQNPATRATLAGLRESLLAHGFAPDRAAQAAFALVAKAAGQQVTVQSFSDLYLICLVVTLAGLVPTVFLKSKQA